MKERDIIINIDKCRDDNGNEDVVPDELGDDGVGSMDNNKEKKEKGRVGVSAKKSPKPPRPPGPRALSLDAADQMLIKEILMIKRARKAAFRKTKPPTNTSTSTSSFIAMLFTILFCLVIVFQGCHSSGIWPRSASDIAVSTSSPNPNKSSQLESINLMGMVPRSDDDKATH